MLQIPAFSGETKSELKVYIDTLTKIYEGLTEVYEPRNDYDVNASHMQYDFLKSYDEFFKKWQSQVRFWRIQNHGGAFTAVTEDGDALLFEIPESDEQFADIVKSDWNSYVEEFSDNQTIDSLINEFVSDYMWNFRKYS